MARPKRQGIRIYTRKRGSRARYYVDLRAYSDVLRPEESVREALVPDGETMATSDADVARKLAAERADELERRRRSKHLLGIKRESTLAEYAAYHLEQKAAAGAATEAWLEQVEMHLRSAAEFFGAGRNLDTIGVEDVQRWVGHLAQQPRRTPRRCPECGCRRVSLSGLAASCAKCEHAWRVAPLSGGSRRKYLNSLSNLYRRAQGEGYVTPGFNPVASLMEKPKDRREEARWLEVHEAALLLEAARLFVPDRPDIAMPYAYPLVATFLLSGGRTREVLGLEWDDISFDRKTITFRPNRWRRLKTGTSRRAMPLWPQLQKILQEYLASLPGPPGRLLFPSVRTNGKNEESMVTDVRKLLDAVAERCGWEEGEIRSRMFRHTYCAARIQTLDNGAPVSLYTVARELGHGGLALVHRVYSHLGEVRHRSEVVEYRVDEFADLLGERLVALRAQPQEAPQCRATTPAGERCRVRVGLSPEELCLWHDPERVEEAARARGRAGERE
jgi:integrase